MRRVRNQNNYHNNPLVMFSHGVEQIVREKSQAPTRYTDRELEEMLRKEKSMTQDESVIRGVLVKFNLVALLRDLFWADRQARV